MVLVLLAAVLSAVSAQYVNIPAIKQQAAREGWTFRVAENPATQHPLSELTGFVPPKDWQKMVTVEHPVRRLGFPSHFDWREQVAGGMPPIKNQGGCGSCWAFSTVGALECAIKIKDGINVDLSEQYYVSCNTDGWSCGGGWYAHAYEKDKQGKDLSGPGAVPESDFPYVATDVDCGGPHVHSYLIKDYGAVMGDVGAVDDIKQAIVDHGPVSIALAVDGNFQAYSGGIFNANTATSINHAVVLVGWDDNNGNGYWILRNSWGPGWGESGYMRICWGVDLVGYNTTWIDYPGRSPLGISLPGGVPQTMSPGRSTTIAVDFNEVSDAYAPGTGVMRYRYSSGGTFSSVPLVHVADNHYTATLPPTACGDEPEYYVEATGISGGVARYPVDAPLHTCASVVGDLTTVLYDNFESSLGWTVQNSTSLTGGAFTRVVPNGGGTHGDPPTDYDASGKCYVTGTGTTKGIRGSNCYSWLISPALNLSGGSAARLHYALWFTNNTGTYQNQDTFKVSVSNDGGSTWTLVETVGPSTASGWNVHELTLPASITLTATMKVRFEASKVHSGAVVEAGIDDVRMYTLACQNPLATAPAPMFQPGWVWFSIPLIPSAGATNASTILGFDCTNRLYGWDGVMKNIKLYPDDFTDLTVGPSYLALLKVTEAFNPSYRGEAPAKPFSCVVGRPGWSWIGVPGLDEYLGSNLLVRQGSSQRTQQEDAAAANPWLNWNWVYWDTTGQTARIMSPSGGGDDRYVHPWYGYRVWCNTDGVTIVFP